MIILLKVIYESINQAFSQIQGNKLRSFLSLMGISIGIFCIIGVGAAVDSLQTNVISSFEELGDDVVYVNQFDWGEDPGDNYWKWRKRPNPSIKDFKAIKAKVKSAAFASFQVFCGIKTLKFKERSVEGSFVLGVTEDYGKMFGLEFAHGRFFSPVESATAAPKCVLGATVAKELFNTTDVTGKRVKFFGKYFEIIGVLVEKGESLVDVNNFDQGVLIPYELATRILNFKTSQQNGGSMLSVKARYGVPRQKLTDEVIGALRASRQIKPADESNFAVNNVSIITSLLDKFFVTISRVGQFVGFFAILVGMFSVANIMFVSVKERTNIIGIKKALGAKRYIILLEFLIESSILCLIGGFIGIVLVSLVAKAASSFSPWEIFLSSGNIIFGIILSIVIGVLAGIIPAWQAANMDPVIAIRSK